ncbi:HNH endonuclease [Mesoplasma photuris]|uniref:HNH endonuclease n=1 Tax=Mesoplasma photuris TaxID=217731 RepID=UPI0004E0E505|nr:HNH endonuclease signature motif containing protein [Mesoplasma photuris]
MVNTVWRAPGNSNIFDLNFDKINPKENNITTRTYFVLKFFEVNKNVSVKKITELNSKLKDFLCKNYPGFKKNNTTIAHFYKPLIFYGFLDILFQEDNDIYCLSAMGKGLIQQIEDNNFEKAEEIFLASTLDVSFPNLATPRATNLNLFPFRILYLLLNKYGYIPKKFVKKKLVLISDQSDLENVLKSYDKFTKTSEDEVIMKKFDSWVIKSLISSNILKSDQKKYYLTSKAKENLKKYSVINPNSCFINGGQVYDIEKKIKPSRDPRLAIESYEKSNYLCQLDSRHDSFIKNDGTKYLESHHVIWMKFEGIFNFKVDVIENLLALCAECHRKVHHANKEERVIKIEEMYELKKNYLITNNISLEELINIYINDNKYEYDND